MPRERPFDFYVVGRKFKKKISDKVHKISRMIKQTKFFIQDGVKKDVKKRRARKCQQTNGHKLTFDI